MSDSEGGDERAIFRALLFTGDTASRAWNLCYRVSIQLKFVSDGSSVKLLGIHEDKHSYVYELSLEARISVKMKSDFVQWHVSRSDGVEAVGARFMTPTEADKFLSCFQQLLADVRSRQQKMYRRSLESQPAVLIPHPSVRPSSALQLTVSLPDGRKRTDTASHSTRLREVLARVCQAERLSIKYFYLKPEKLRLDPEPAPLDMELTVGEVKVSKLQLVDRRENPAGKSQISFLKTRGEEREKEGQVTLLNGTFKRFDETESIADVAPRQAVQFVSPTRLLPDRREGEERIESPIDSVDELELAAPFRDVFRQEMPKRSSSLRSRGEDESSSNKSLSNNLISSVERPSYLSRVTFSESDIREAFDQSELKARPSTPSRRRAPKPPRTKLTEPAEPESNPETEFLQEKSKKSPQVPLFKVSQEVSNQLRDEFSQRLTEIRLKSPDKLANQNAELEPLASSTPDKRPIKVKPHIAPKPSHLSISRIKQSDTPSFPLYPSTPPTGDLLTSEQGTCRGVKGRVEIWKAKEVNKEPQQLVFRPQNSDPFESEPLIFNLPGPPTDSPPATPPPMRFPPECDTTSEPIEMESLIPPPLEDFYQSNLLPSSPPSPPSPRARDSEITSVDDILISDIDQSNDSDYTSEDLIVLPPPHFLSLSDADFVDFPPPSPLRLSLSLDGDLSLGAPPSPNYEPMTNSLVTELNNRNVVPSGTELNMTRVRELLTAAADSLITGETRQPTEASELVKAALELIATDSKKTEPEFLIKSSYNKSDEKTDISQREAPNFSKFGTDFNACMQDIRADNPPNLRATNEDGTEGVRDDVVAAVAKAMKERRQQLEQTNSLSDPSHSSLPEDWK